jgi:hypothetical protein
MTQFTPGPWTVKAGDGCRGIHGTDGHGRIAKITMRRSITAANLTELDANARLIAAAPDLLAALRALLLILECEPDTTDELSLTEKAARAAIAKATGAK